MEKRDKAKRRLRQTLFCVKRNRIISSRGRSVTYLEASYGSLRSGISDRRHRRTSDDDRPAAVSWAAHLGWLPLENTPLAFLGFAVMPYIIIVLAIGELISDQLPKTPSRKVPNKPEEMNQIAGPGPNAHNRVGSFIGPMAASFRVNPPDGPCKGDLETAEIYADEVQKSRFNFSVEKAAKYAIADRIAGCSPR